MRIGYTDEQGQKYRYIECVCSSKKITDINTTSYSFGDFEVVVITLKCNDCYNEWQEADINLFIDSY